MVDTIYKIKCDICDREFSSLWEKQLNSMLAVHKLSKRCMRLQPVEKEE